MSRRFALVLALGCALLAPRAFAAEEADELRAKIVDGDDAARASALKSIELRPPLVGVVIGGILRDASRSDAQKRDAAVRAAAWLAERPPLDKEPMLLDDVFRRAGDDAEFARLVRAAVPASGPGWARIVEGARRRAKDPAAPIEARSGAVQFLGADPTLASASDLLDVWAGGATESLRLAARAGLDATLAYRFPDVDAARRWFDAHKSAALLDAVRELSGLKDTPQHPAYLRLVTESKRNLERTTKLDELAPYLRPKETPWPEVRRLAARHGNDVTGEPAAWVALLAEILRDEDDKDTLEHLLEVTAHLGDTGSSIKNSDLAQSILLRLGECCNAPAVQRGLLDLLAKAGDHDSVSRAHEAISKTKDVSVEEAWLRAAATVGDLDVSICSLHQSRAGKDDDASVALRTRALEALGMRRGTDWQQSAVARAYLFGVLRPAGVNGDAVTENMPREVAALARAAGIQSLESFPGPETHQRLAILSRSPPEQPEHARLAASVLAKLAAKDEDAARRLFDVAREIRTRADVRLEAIEGLARVVDDGGAASLHADALAYVDSLIKDAAADAPLRVGAAAVAASLADPRELDAVADLCVELSRSDAKAPAEEAGRALDRLVRAIAKADARHDAPIVAAIERIAAAGATDTAIALADAAADAGEGRLALQTLRASLRLARAKAPESATRRADLEEAHRTMRTALKAADGGDNAALVLRAQKTEFDVALALLADAETKNGLRRSALLAVIAAANAIDAGSAAVDGSAAIARAQPYLDAARALTDLSAEELRLLSVFAAKLAPK